MAKIKIDKDVPIPERSGSFGPKPKYPWLTMEIGHSFLMPSDVKWAITYATRANHAYAPRRFTSRTTHEGIRIWRIA